MLTAWAILREPWDVDSAVLTIAAGPVDGGEGVQLCGYRVETGRLQGTDDVLCEANTLVTGGSRPAFVVAPSLLLAQVATTGGTPTAGSADVYVLSA